MNIVLIGKYNNTELLNGPEKVARRLFENTGSRESAVTFVDYFFRKAGKRELLLRLFGKETLSPDGKILRLGIVQLFFFLLKTQPDIIHFVTEERFQMSIFLYRFLLKGKIFVTVHGLLIYESEHLPVKYSAFSRLKDRMLEYLLLTLSDRLIFVSQKMLDLSAKYYKIDRGRVKIIPNGVDPDFFCDNKKFDFTGSVRIVIYSGGIRNDKAEERLKAVFKEIVTDRKIEVFILGQFDNESEEHGAALLRYCTLLPKEDLKKFLEDKHLYININEYESFSIFALECMASGLIPVVSREVGMSVFIESGVNGFRVEDAASEELKDLLENIIKGRFDLGLISRNAALIKEKLSWSEISEKYIEVYKQESYE